MITCTLEEITELDHKALRDWANQGPANMMLKVVMGKEADQSCRALSTGLRAQFGAQQNLSAEHMNKARRYTTFLEVWEEILSDQGRPKIAHLQQK